MAARKHSLTAALVAALGLAAGPAAGSAPAAVFLCVPTTAGPAVTSGGSDGTCASGRPVELPESRVDQRTLISILPYMSFNASGIAGKPTITFKGANVQIVNGLGSTGTINGAGNLFLGYNESPGEQTGSHSLITGQANTFKSVGQIVSGTNNRALGAYSVVFGYNNAASGTMSTVTGGHGNTASNFATSVTGGYANVAGGTAASVSGGCGNLAGVGSAAAVSTCTDAANLQDGSYTSVAGGARNVAKGPVSSVLGGNQNTAAARWSTIEGGKSSLVGAANGTADGTRFWVRMDGAGTKVADGGTVHGQQIGTYSYSGGWKLAWFPGLDTSRCGVSVEPDSSDAEIGYRYVAGEYVYVQVKRNGQPLDGVGVSITLDCNNPTTS